MTYDMCVVQNSTPCVGGYALRVPRYYPPIPEWTIRVKMATTDDAPLPTKTGATVKRLYADEDIYDVTYADANWNGLLYRGSSSHPIAEVLGSNTTGVTNMGSLFAGQEALSSVTGMTTENVTNMSFMFRGCYGLTTVDLFDTRKVTTVSNMFNTCTSLTTSPLFVTNNVTDMYRFFRNCTALTRVPLFSTEKVTRMADAFWNCRQVAGGAYALYRQASRQTTPPSSHSLTFWNCGADTTSGADELALIPSGWK